MKQAEITFSLNGIADAARSFLQLTAGWHIFTFTGELGAGKTTFIAALCRELGVKEIVSSPTFAIIQQYHARAHGNIYHMDLYRIRDDEEAIRSGVEDCLISGDICMVEWPGNAAGIFPDTSVNSEITIINRDERKIVIHIPE